MMPAHVAWGDLREVVYGPTPHLVAGKDDSPGGSTGGGGDGDGGEDGPEDGNGDGDGNGGETGPAEGGPRRLTGFQRDVLLAISDIQRNPREDHCTASTIQTELERRYAIDLSGSGERDLDRALNSLLDRGAIRERETDQIELTDIASTLLYRSMEIDAQRIGLHFECGELVIPPDVGGDR